MKVNFRTYCGEPGDLQELLIAETDTSGAFATELIPRTGWFRYYRMKRAKKRLLRKLELLTGQKHIEI